MKISTKLFNEQQIRQFSSLNADIQKLQDRISSGKNIVVASDDPVGSVDLSGYKTVKQQLDQYLKNVNSAQTRLSLVDTNLQNLSTIMIRANELLIQASSDVLGRSDREAIAIEIDEMKEELLSLANQQDANGSFIFGGFKTKTQPFQKNIDALDKKIGLLIQKWENTLEVNRSLNERNKELEAKLSMIQSDRLSEPTETETDNNSKLHNIETALETYINRIDECLELINIELDGK